MSALTDAKRTRIDGVLNRIGDADPGVAALVVLEGQVVFRSGRGLANLEYGIPITSTTSFHIASMSKQFTGFALALVAERGLLDLDGDVRRHLPDVPELGGAVLTPRQLAHHTSGLRDQWGALVLSGWRMDDVISTRDVLALVGRTRSLNFAPGTGFSYSNTGYTLIGELVRAVDGRSLRDFCAQELFAPLGMESTHFHDRYDELVPGRAYSYVPQPSGGYGLAQLSYATSGATSLHSTVEDLALWDNNLSERTVGSDAAFALMDEVGVLRDGTSTGYAFGLMHDTYRGQHRAHHSGGDAGFRTHGERFPDLGLAVYVLANSSSLDPSRIARDIADVVMDELQVSPSKVPETLAVQNVSRFAGSYVDHDTGLTLTLTADDGQVRYLGMPLAHSDPDELTFSSRLSLRFSDNAGPAIWVDCSMSAVQTKRFHRYSSITPSRDDLRELTGTYWSDELDALYAVAHVDDVLVLRHRKHGTMPLTPTTRDCFATALKTGAFEVEVALAFDRDDTGVVSRLRLSQARVHNIEANPVTWPPL